MKSYDYEAVAYESAVYCVDCLPKGVSVGSEDVCPIFADSEWDYIPTCDVCGAEHDYVTVLSDEDTEESTEPQEGDITTPDHCKFYRYGKLIFEVFEHDKGGYKLLVRGKFNGNVFASVEAAIGAYMDEDQFWPNCWFVSDHGNAHRIEL